MRQISAIGASMLIAFVGVCVTSRWSGENHAAGQTAIDPVPTTIARFTFDRLQATRTSVGRNGRCVQRVNIRVHAGFGFSDAGPVSVKQTNVLAE